MLQINGAEITKIQDKYFVETGQELSFKDAVAKYKAEKGLTL